MLDTHFGFHRLVRDCPSASYDRAWDVPRVSAVCNGNLRYRGASSTLTAVQRDGTLDRELGVHKIW